jgi:hypothetical protein
VPLQHCALAQQTPPQHVWFSSQQRASAPSPQGGPNGQQNCPPIAATNRPLGAAVKPIGQQTVSAMQKPWQHSPPQHSPVQHWPPQQVSVVVAQQPALQQIVPSEQRWLTWTGVHSLFLQMPPHGPVTPAFSQCCPSFAVVSMHSPVSWLQLWHGSQAWQQAAAEEAH